MGDALCRVMESPSLRGVPMGGDPTPCIPVGCDPMNIGYRTPKILKLGWWIPKYKTPAKALGFLAGAAQRHKWS